MLESDNSSHANSQPGSLSQVNCVQSSNVAVTYVSKQECHNTSHNSIGFSLTSVFDVLGEGAKSHATISVIRIWQVVQVMVLSHLVHPMIQRDTQESKSQMIRLSHGVSNMQRRNGIYESIRAQFADP